MSGDFLILDRRVLRSVAASSRLASRNAVSDRGGSWLLRKTPCALRATPLARLQGRHRPCCLFHVRIMEIAKMRQACFSLGLGVLSLTFLAAPLYSVQGQCSRPACECAIPLPTIDLASPPPAGFGSMTAGFNAAEPATGGSVEWRFRGAGQTNVSENGETFSFSSLTTQTMACGNTDSYTLSVGGNLAGTLDVVCSNCAGGPSVGGGSV